MLNTVRVVLTIIVLHTDNVISIYPAAEQTTKGEVWPKVKMENKQDTFFIFAPTRLDVKVPLYSCHILEEAVERYKQVPVNLYRISRQNGIKSSKWVAPFQRTYSGLFTALTVNLINPCEVYPHFGVDESYNLTISSKSVLTSASIWGILHGLETAAQLFYLSDDYTEVLINSTTIVDYPSYPYRGYLLDTARHYISVDNILKTLDAMAMNKMNVLHWHIVDDESFPYQSLKMPELSAKGAFHPRLVYSRSHIQAVISHARDRGIRVIPEFDFTGMRLTVFGRSMHPQLQKYIYRMNMKSTQQLHVMFLTRVLKFLRNDTVPIVWQEAFHLGIPLPPGAMVQVWRATLTSEMRAQMIEALNQSRQVILSAPWHLDNLQSTFFHLYTPSPRAWVDDMVEPELLQYIVGGVACMWGDRVDDTNLLSRSWPRASATAEVLWAEIKPVPDEFATTENEDMAVLMQSKVEGTLGRVQEQACRMRRRTVPAAPPLGPSVCVL